LNVVHFLVVLTTLEAGGALVPERNLWWVRCQERGRKYEGQKRTTEWVRTHGWVSFSGAYSGSANVFESSLSTTLKSVISWFRNLAPSRVAVILVAFLIPPISL